MSSGNLSATVDWCVYGPNDYPGTGYSPETGPYGTGEFAYAYQVFGEGSDYIYTFWVRMIESNEANDISTDSTIGVGGGVVPFDMGFAYPPGEENDSAWYDFDDPGLGSGEHSVALLFSSVNMPFMLDGSIQDGGSALGPLPSPSDVIPEPATLALIAVGVAGVLRRRR